MGHKESKLFQELANVGDDETFESKANKLWTLVDVDGSNNLESEEANNFFGMIYDFLSKKNTDFLDQYCKNMSRDDCIEFWFEFFDTDGNKIISKKEFMDTLNLIANPDHIAKKMAEAKPKGEKSKTLKLMLSGDSNVGKTSLVNRFVKDEYTEEYLAPAQDPSQSKDVTVNSTPQRIEVFDTCGQERFRILTGSYYNQCHGVVLVFDLTSQASLDKVPTWLKQIDHYTIKGTPIVLLGNKSDLKAERKVKQQDIEHLCAEHSLHYFETSAKDNTNVQEGFIHLASIVCGSGNDPSRASSALKPSTNKRTGSSLSDKKTSKKKDK